MSGADGADDGAVAGAHDGAGDGAGAELGRNGTRAVLHVDMDAFYVSVELRRRPELRGRPVVVGGTGDRGVVAAASYEARRFGVFSAMPAVVARRRCPDAVFLPGDHESYARVSAEVHAIFDSVTPFVEPLALDEAFLDVTGSLGLFGSAATIGALLRERIRDELDLPCSVGGGVNKFLAKLASKAAKPRVSRERIEPGHGVLLIAPGRELEFLHPRPVGDLWGVGPATRERLERIGVRTVGELARLDPAVLVGAFGKAQGRQLHDLAWARDDRPVEPNRDPKSIGHEETFTADRHSLDELDGDVVRFADAVATRLRAAGLGARTVTVKVRFSDFVTITRSRTAPEALDTAPAIWSIARELLATVDVGAGVRLLGVSCSGLGPPVAQLSFDFGAERVSAGAGTGAGTGAGAGDGDGDAHGAAGGRGRRSEWTVASDAIDAIRDRFGAAAIGPASSVRNPGDGAGLRVVRRGAQQWGPDAVSEEP